MRLEATNKNVRGGLNKPPPSQVGLICCTTQPTSEKQILLPNISGKFRLIDTELVQTMAVGFLPDKKLYCSAWVLS